MLQTKIHKSLQDRNGDIMRACFILKWQINLGRIQWSNIYGKSLNNQVSVDKGEKKNFLRQKRTLENVLCRNYSWIRLENNFGCSLAYNDILFLSALINWGKYLNEQGTRFFEKIILRLTYFLFVWYTFFDFLQKCEISTSYLLITSLNHPVTDRWL